jgi:hypothetical protein
MGSTVMSEDEARALLLEAIRTVPRQMFRGWLEQRANFRCRRFMMPNMGESWVDETGLTTSKGGLGFRTCGVVTPDLAIYPAWGHHGFPDCSVCWGKACNEFSLGSSANTHTFCFRCVVEITGDGSRVLENLLFLANHIAKDRANGTWSRDTRCRQRGRVPIIHVKQTSPCHTEFFLHYNSNTLPAKLRTDNKICVGHLGGPALMSQKVKRPFWRLCNACYVRLSNKAKEDWGVCGVCGNQQVQRGPMCLSCRKRFEAFVWKRTAAALVV